MAVNKVEFGGETLIDLTTDTVTPSTLALGTTAHNSAGEEITGTMEGGTLADFIIHIKCLPEYLIGDSGQWMTYEPYQMTPAEYIQAYNSGRNLLLKVEMPVDDNTLTLMLPFAGENPQGEMAFITVYEQQEYKFTINILKYGETEDGSNIYLISAQQHETVTYQSVASKTNYLSAASTHEEYPSALATYTAIQDAIQDVGSNNIEIETSGDNVLTNTNPNKVTSVNAVFNVANSLKNTINNTKAEILNNSGLASTQYVDNEVAEVVAIAEGKCHTEVFDTVEALDTWLSNSANTAKLNRGDIFLIRAVYVPDYWWDGSAKQVLETSKIDLADYALKEHSHTAAQVSGLSTVATSGSYNDLTNKPTILTAANNGYGGAITTGGDGVAEMGKYIDFHNTAGGTSDYSTRLVCSGEHSNTVNLPSSTGTLTIGDKAYKIVTSSTAPTTTDTSIITIVI